MYERDDELKELFEEVRRGDETRTPPFARVWAAVSERRDDPARPAWVRGLLPATATAVLVVGLFVVGRWATAPAPSTQLESLGPPAPAIDAWLAPSDRLFVVAEIDPDAPDAGDEPDWGAITSFTSPTAGLLDLDLDSTRRIR